MGCRKKGLGALVVFIAGLFWSACQADEIVFKDHKARQDGVVLEENEEGITILFPKEAIKSISRNNKERIARPSPGKVIVEDSDEYITVKVPRQKLQTTPAPARVASQPQVREPLPGGSDTQIIEKVERLEKKLEGIEKASVAASSAPSNKGLSHETLLRDEMGSVEGAILWKQIPLKGAPVKLVMERYTGFSVAAVKQMFSSSKENSPEKDQVVIESQTDDQGRYTFAQVPPGTYDLYWMPDIQSGWIHRLRDKPDVEVAPGKLAVLNIPEKKKQ